MTNAFAVLERILHKAGCSMKPLFLYFDIHLSKTWKHTISDMFFSKCVYCI